jgi:hypothetical protein
MVVSAGRTRRSARPGARLALLLALLTALPAFALALPTAGASTPHGPSPPAWAHGVPRPIGDPVARHLPRALAPPPLGVDPYLYRSSQPAPMGIADFGVDNNGNVYSYGTSAFLGTANLSSLGWSNPSLSSYGWQYVGTLQLNVVLHFNAGGAQYVYWVQNVLSYETDNHYATFENNIWNFSSGSSAGMLSSSVSGNGSVYSAGGLGGYYATGAGSQAGNGATLTYPAIVQLRVASTVVSGVPRVYFEFDDGQGWQTYDTVTFFASGVGSALFQVDGTNYAPNSLYSDAELVFGGPGSGYAQTLTNGSVGLSLQFDNGHNYQEVPNAFNFGGDTAEAVSNAVMTRATVSDLPTSHLAYGTSSSLGNLYDRSYSAILNGTSTYASGSYAINGTVMGPFRNHEVNLTLAPGSYQVSLVVNGSTVASGDITLADGEYLAFDFTPAKTYNATFSSSGLPAGTLWGVRVDSQQVTTTSPSLNVSLPNGTFTYQLLPVPGYVPSAWTGSVTVQGGPLVGPAIPWTVYRDPFTFTETGLPAGSVWFFELNGTNYTAGTTPFTVHVPNGTYTYSIPGVPGYRPTVPAGNIVVQGPDQGLTVRFVASTFRVTLTAAGLPTGSGWEVVVAGQNYLAPQRTITLLLPNGTYSYQAPKEGGYTPAAPAGNFVVDGTDLTVTVDYQALPGTLELTLQPTTGGQVTVNGASYSVGTNGTLTVELAPGNYTIVVQAPGYASATQNVTISPGQPLNVVVPLTPKPAPPRPSPGGGSGGGPSPFLTPTVLLVVIGVAAVAAIGAAAAVRRRRPGPPSA